MTAAEAEPATAFDTYTFVAPKPLGRRYRVLEGESERFIALGDLWPSRILQVTDPGGRELATLKNRRVGPWQDMSGYDGLVGPVAGVRTAQAGYATIEDRDGGRTYELPGGSAGVRVLIRGGVIVARRAGREVGDELEISRTMEPLPIVVGLIAIDRARRQMFKGG